MKFENFEKALTGGHPNSLGNTEELVTEVFKNPERFDELFNCYFSDDEVVRLRVSSCMKRIEKSSSNLVYNVMDRLLSEVSKIDQASTQWTLAQLFLAMQDRMTGKEIVRAKEIMKINLDNSDDWIVLIQTAVTLAKWSKDDNELLKWLQPKLENMSKDSRKSVSNKAKKLLLEFK